MQPWKFRKMRRTKSMRWIKKTVIRTNDDELAALGAARLSGDQAALLQVVRKAKPAGKRAIIDYITDPVIFDIIAYEQYDVQSEVWETAVRKTSNLPLLRRLAFFGGFYAAAVDTITDETLLVEVAKTAEWEKAGVLAFRKLTDEALRQSVYGEDALPSNRLHAAIELGNQSIIARYVMNPQETDWFAAVENCTDIALLETQLQDERLTLPQREYLYKRFGRNEEAAFVMLRYGEITFNRIDLLNQISKPDLLMDLVKNTSDWYLRPEAVKNWSNQISQTRRSGCVMQPCMIAA